MSIRSICTAIFGCLAASAFLFLLSTAGTGGSAAEEVTVSVTSEESVLYLVKSQEGRIGVFLPDAQAPEYWLETKPSLLPEYDQQLLAQGIPIYREEDLISLLEDLDS